MNILFVGDIFSKAGRLAMQEYIHKIKEKYPVDFTILNGENTTHGKGLNINHYNEIITSGVDFITLGNHFLDNGEVCKLLKDKTNIIRPLNLDNIYDGDGSKVISVNNIKIRITNLVGRVYVNIRGQDITNPYEALDDLLDECDEKIHIVDFHAEANGEKKSLAKYFDGRVSAVIGTHTHVQTADNQVLSNGTAYISDVGYCGAYDSVLGIKNGDAILFSKNQDYRAHSPQDEGDLEFSAVYLNIDENTGKCNSIKRIYITPNHRDITLLD